MPARIRSVKLVDELDSLLKVGQASGVGFDQQECPVCGNGIGLVAGSKEAICTNCGFKDPCCE